MVPWGQEHSKGLTTTIVELPLTTVVYPKLVLRLISV